MATEKVQATDFQDGDQTSNLKGELTFDDKVIQKIVGYAIENVDGLLGVDGWFVANITNKIVNSDNPTDGIEVEVGKEQVAVDLDIIMEYGHNAHDIYDQLKQVIAKHVKKITSLVLVEINVEVVDIQTQKEFNESQTTLQDRISSASENVKSKASDSREKVKQNVQSLNEKSDRVKWPLNRLFTVNVDFKTKFFQFKKYTFNEYTFNEYTF